MPDFELPAGFRFGVATAGFQIEGGYNGPGEPANNWYAWETEGRVEPSGVALDFWNRYEHHLDRAVAAGVDAFRLSVEWARCETADGHVDNEALDRYAAILDACHDRSLQPLVTLHHFTHPEWLGVDFWLRPDSPERFVGWVDTAVDRLAGRCQHWVTINEINVYALQTYLLGSFPPGRMRDVAATVRTLDHMLAAHVGAYDAIKRRQPQAVVSTNNYSFTLYEIDRLLIDVLLARANGIGRYDVRAWLTERRAEYHARAMATPPLLERGLLRRIAAAAIPLEQALPRAIGAIYGSEHERTLDVTQIDFYQPVAAGHIRVPGHRTAGGRRSR
jgi:beta-glucosidase/6-phospho-beta-glucosidase/beta-galactosidase